MYGGGFVRGGFVRGGFVRAPSSSALAWFVMWRPFVSESTGIPTFSVLLSLTKDQNFFWFPLSRRLAPITFLM